MKKQREINEAFQRSYGATLDDGFDLLDDDESTEDCRNPEWLVILSGDVEEPRPSGRNATPDDIPDDADE